MSNLERALRRVAELEAELAELHRERSQLRQIIDLVPDFIFATDAEGRFLIVNRALAAAYGSTVERVTGLLERDLTPDRAQSDRLLADNAEVLATGRAKFVPEQQVVDALGRRMVVQIHRIPYREAASDRPAVLGVGTDISERKRHEELQREKARVDQELAIARLIQRSVLPVAKPALPGFAIAGWNRSADETGGDYFDWLTLPDGRTLLCVGDVSGHGVGPALIVAACRAYFRATAHASRTLAEAISRANQLLSADLPENRFVTLAVGLLDGASGRLELFSAGHGPILLYDASAAEVHAWPADDPPLGLLVGDVPEGAARVLELDPGDALVLVTDGFFEWADPAGQLYGVERLRAAVRAHAALGPEELIAALYDDVRRFAGGTRQADDLTALVLKRLP
jgi:PAS domain S-box-containing protein